MGSPSCTRWHLTHENTYVVIKGLEHTFLVNLLMKTHDCSHIIHNQAMYQQNWLNSSHNKHFYA